MAISPAEYMVQTSFLNWIKIQEEDIRLSQYRFYDNYYFGDHIDTLHPEVKKVYENPLSVVCNYCRAVVDVVVDYICGKPVSIDVNERGIGSEYSEAARVAEDLLYNIYRQNGLMGRDMIKLVRILSKKGDVFIKLRTVGDGTIEGTGIKLSVLRPDMVFPKYRDDDYDELDMTAIKSFRLTPEGRRAWFAEVFSRDRIELYDLGEKGDVSAKYQEDKEGNLSMSRRWYHFGAEHRGTDWKLVDVQENLLGQIPVFHIRNGADDLPFGVSDLHDITDLQDSLNKTMTDLMVSLDNDAFQRLFIFGGHATDELLLGPGQITEVPNEQGRLDVIPAGNINAYLMAINTIIEQISSVSRTPKQVFLGYDNVPTSGYALAIRFMKLEAKCNEKRTEIIHVLQQLNTMILRIAGEFGWIPKEIVPLLSTVVSFPGGLPKDRISEAQEVMIYMQMGLMSEYDAMVKLGFDNIPERMARIQEERARMAALMAQQEGGEGGE